MSTAEALSPRHGLSAQAKADLRSGNAPRRQSDTEPFDLRGLIRAEIDKTGEPNPHVVAAAVAESLPRDIRVLRDVIAATLPDFVRTMNYKPHREPPRLTPVSGGRTPSKRWTEAGSQYRAFRRQAVCIDEAGSVWKRMDECTRDELLLLAGIRKEKAAANLAKAETYEAIAEKMRCHRAATVADLDDGLLAEVLR